MRRFDQFIRQADHFGKRQSDLNAAHHHRHRFLAWVKHCFPRAGEFMLRGIKGKQMLEMNDDLRSRRIAMLVFALLSAVSAASTALAPALLHI
jgi:hypothetical protein